ncbi:protease [Wenjunlia vitaminophila]|uniref:Protease n=1 Tax=Wenjunlia vitaminophila TaxID=76728 RepID=A0A0T6LQH8_WENVI|nr:trypsin-like peptidase domain-containing protein [Wenjunlia vitaminophila]KRV48095.1 protease [Wenjunlia vitaminophila]
MTFSSPLDNPTPHTPDPQHPATPAQGHPGGQPQGPGFGPPAPQAVFGSPPPPTPQPHTSTLPAWPPQPGNPGGPKKSRGGLVALVAAVALVAGALGGGLGYLAADESDSSSQGGSSTVSTSADPAALNRKPDSVAGIADKALPSVVTIEADGSSGSSTGTGFVYDKEGHILTNNHVVSPAANGGDLSVTFSNGKEYEASVIGHAEGYDVAVIKIDNPGDAKLVPLPLGDSEEVVVGDATIAIGAPFGLSGTVTTGIVSAKDRPVAAGGENGSQPSYMSAIQTDASINPGNSGGPLLDASGRVIGINSAIQPGGSSDPMGGQSGGSIGLGFAIPINQAKWVAATLIESGEPVYAQLGVLRNDEYEGKGAQIAPRDMGNVPAVTPNGPADKAGLKPGDVITKLNDQLIEGGPQLVSEIWTHRPGDEVTVTYKRDGQEHTTTVTLGERKGDNP